MARTSALKFCGIVVMLVFLFLGGRLFQLQMVMGQHYADMSQRNAIRMVAVPAPRGILYDRDMRPIVASRMAYRVFVDMQELARRVPGVAGQNAVFAELTDLLWPYNPADGLSPQAFHNEKRAILDAKRDDVRRRPYEPVVPMNDADAATVSRLLEHKAQLPGVTVEEFPTRQYVHEKLASHVVGYLSEIDAEELSRLRDKGYRMGDLVGKSGVEKVYEPYLRGTDGGLQVEVNNVGEPIRVLGVKPPVAGRDVVLTLDLGLQEAAERAFANHLAGLNLHAAPNAHGGAVIAMDPRTGRILAMVSWPEFDPNIFVSSEARKDVSKVFTDPGRPALNRAISGEYAYGSVFKMVVAVAALEEHRIDQTTRWYCDGYDPVYPLKKCWTVGKGIIHGEEDLIAGIKNSCNIVFYDLGRRLGPDKLAKWARTFGFGGVTGIELPGESKGLVPTKAWKHTISPYPWYFTESMDYGIGQGYMSGTPLQMARAYCAFLNGGTLYKPQLVKEILGPKGAVVKRVEPEVEGHVAVSDKNRAMVKEGLHEVASVGTAAAALAGFPIPMGAKTGTAQVPPYDPNGWFVGFAPLNKPEIVVVVLVEHGMSGAGGAAPIGRKVLEAYFGITKPDKSTSDVAVRGD